MGVPRIPKYGVKKQLTKRYEQITIESSAINTDFTPTAFIPSVAGEITEIKFYPSGAVSANDTDYLTLDVINGSTGIVTARTTKSTGGTALARATAYSFTITEGTVAAGDVIAMRIINSGSGKAFPGGILRIYFEPN